MTLPPEIEFIVSQNDKGNNPKRPDYRGEVKFAGQTYELAAWKRTTKDGTRRFVSGKLSLKVDKVDPGAYSPPPPPTPAPTPSPSAPTTQLLPFAAPAPADDVPF